MMILYISSILSSTTECFMSLTKDQEVTVKTIFFLFFYLNLAHIHNISAKRQRQHNMRPQQCRF